MRTAGSSVKNRVQRAANWALHPVGARLLMGWEEAVLDSRYHEVVADLEAQYAGAFPGLGRSPRRVELLCGLIGTSVPEALHLLGYLHQALSATGGDVCEMGVAQGATSALIANEIGDGDRTLWLYDSFEGLSAPTADDQLIDDMFGLGSMDRYTGTMAAPVREVEHRLDAVGFPANRRRIVPGFIRPDLEATSLPAQVAFAYLDFDLYEPIRVGLRLMHDRSRPGSILMVDDFRYFSSGVEAAVRDFLAEHPGAYELLEPTSPSAGHFCALERQSA